MEDGMKYMMLIADEADYWQGLSEAKQHETFDRIGRWWGELVQKGKIGEGHQLQPAHTATTVKIRSGDAVVTDGPFTETKETVGGYGILNVADLDEALAIVKTWPANAKIEVRPVVEREGM
jgi:hypothetical protein